jgi:hypothetical protein
MSSLRLSVHTSDLKGAGTNAAVFATVFGTKGETGERALDRPHCFERGKARRCLAQLHWG